MTIILVVMLIAGITGFILGTLYWDQYVTYYDYTSLRTGKTHTRPSGWPYTLRVICGWMLGIASLSMIMNIIALLRTKIGFALNRNGFLFTQPGALKPLFAEWKDISSIQDFNNARGKGATIHFHSIDDLIKKQAGEKKAGYISKKPVTLHPDTAKGDIEGFVTKLKTYFQSSNPAG